jgi:hypothetical protein
MRSETVILHFGKWVEIQISYSGIFFQQWFPDKGPLTNSQHAIRAMRQSRGLFDFYSPDFASGRMRRFGWSFSNRTVPVTPAFEDDMIAVASVDGNCWRPGSAYERARFLHSFALYRWYRAAKRRMWPPRAEPAVFGQLDFPSVPDLNEA